jgi:hypothetical protein
MMRTLRQEDGFSLTETLLAVGTLAVGMLFVAGSFLTGIYFTTVSTERTIAAVAADEAFTKMRLYGLDPNDEDLDTGGFVPYESLRSMPDEEHLYPSIDGGAARQYSWAIICRREADDSRLVRCTAFVNRKVGAASKFWVPQDGDGQGLEEGDLPRPVLVTLESSSGDDDEVLIQDATETGSADERTFVDAGSIIVDDATGDIYRVLERSAGQYGRVTLDRPWEGADLTSPASVWVVPPPVAGGRRPLVAVYQEVIRF